MPGLVLNWFPQTGMSRVVVAAPLTEELPATPQTAIRANSRSAISTFSHSAIVTGRTYVAVTSAVFDLAILPVQHGSPLRGAVQNQSTGED